MGFLRYDSDFMVMLGRIADYVILNVLCVIFSIPLFTVGAAVTAKYYVAMKLARKEEPNVFKAFINSFRDNFKQATLLWLLSVFLSAFLAMDWFLLKKTGMTNAVSFFQIALFVLTVLVVMSVFCVFPDPRKVSCNNPRCSAQCRVVFTFTPSKDDTRHIP